jgi:hypothetical protein
MKYVMRAFLFLNGKIKRVGVDRFSQISHEPMPEYAGQKIPYALLMFEFENGKLGDLRHHDCSYLVFDKKGNLDLTNGWSLLELDLARESDPKSFAARRANGLKREIRWNPAGEQLDRMIALVKKRG